jgi:sugar phosphate isomerase/epimerase
MPTRIAVQLYTLREFLKTPADIAATLKRVRQIGYEAVQVSGLGPIEPAELSRILRGEGLRCVVTHMGLNRFETDFDRVVEEHRLWGCSYTAIGGFWKDNAVAEDWERFAESFGQLGEKFAAAGMRLGYHNHSHEFIKPAGSSLTAMDILLKRLPPSVWFEIDTYWVQHGGADPADWIERCKSRIPVVHVKDMSVSRSEGKVSQVMSEVGEGNLNWGRILPACRSAGVEWYAVEQDVCQRDPFESIAISLSNLRRMGVN